MRYRVTKQFARGSENPCAQFDDLNDARLFVEVKLSSDANLNVKTIYRLYQAYDLLEEFNPTEGGSSSTTTTSQSSGGKGATSRPSPFSTAPKPAGMPSKWSSFDDDDEKKK